jgi:hypothetical protein
MFHDFDLAPGARAVLDSSVMHSSSSKVSFGTGAPLFLGSLSLLLRR